MSRENEFVLARYAPDISRPELFRYRWPEGERFIYIDNRVGEFVAASDDGKWLVCSTVPEVTYDWLADPDGLEGGRIETTARRKGVAFLAPIEHGAEWITLMDGEGLIGGAKRVVGFVPESDELLLQGEKELILFSPTDRSVRKIALVPPGREYDETSIFVTSSAQLVPPDLGDFRISTVIVSPSGRYAVGNLALTVRWEGVVESTFAHCVVADLVSGRTWEIRDRWADQWIGDDWLLSEGANWVVPDGVLEAALSESEGPKELLETVGAIMFKRDGSELRVLLEK